VSGTQEYRNSWNQKYAGRNTSTNDLLKLKSEANNNVSTAEVIHRQWYWRSVNETGWVVCLVGYFTMLYQLPKIMYHERKFDRMIINSEQGNKWEEWCCIIYPKLCKISPTKHLWRRRRDKMYSSYSFKTSALNGGEWSASRPGPRSPGRPLRSRHCTDWATPAPQDYVPSYKCNRMIINSEHGNMCEEWCINCPRLGTIIWMWQNYY
jgi:hypothetical protein